MPSVLRDIRGAGMQNLIYPRLPRAEQRVVPTVLGFFYKTDPFNASMLARMDMPARLASPSVASRTEPSFDCIALPCLKKRKKGRLLRLSKKN